MNETLLTISLLIIVVCNLGVLLMYILLRFTLIDDFFFLGMHVSEEAKITRERIAQVKTRLADEERDDQKRKAMKRIHERWTQSQKGKSKEAK